jgi:hypothetical protein
MADQKLSQLTAATTPLTGTESVYVVQSATSRKTTTQAIAALAPGTDLTYTAATRTLASSTGADVVLPEATSTDAGLQSAVDKAKLDSITVDRADLTVAEVRNTSGVQIPKGAPVYVTGSSGTVKTVAMADASAEATAANTLGLALTAIDHNSNGLIVTEGPLDGVNTSTLTEGALVFLSETTGALTSTRPIPPAHGVVIGWCVKQGAGTAGILYVKVDNGQEIDELHDVLITNPVTGQVLRRAADGLWKNHTLTAGDVGADPAGTASAAVSAHVAAADPHPGYLTAAEGNAAYATAAQGALAATAVQPGAIGSSGLTMGAGLLGRETGTGAIGTFSIGSGLAVVGGALVVTAGGTGTDLSYTAASRTLASSTGADAVLPLMSSTEAGLVPASGGGTTNFLRADGTFATPPGAGLGPPSGGIDRVLIWDESQQAWVPGSVGAGLEITGTTLSATSGVSSPGGNLYLYNNFV